VPENQNCIVVTLIWRIIVLEQRFPAHSALATCGEWLCFQTFQNLDVLDKTTLKSKPFYLIYTLNTPKWRENT